MFTGRIGILFFWKATALLFMLYVFVGIIGGLALGVIGIAAIESLPAKTFLEMLGGDAAAVLITAVPLVLMSIIGAVLGIGLIVRRFHDIGFSGFFAIPVFLIKFTGLLGYLGLFSPFSPLLWIISGLAPLCWVLIAFWPGSSSANDYGEPLIYRSWFAALIGDRTDVVMQLPSIANTGNTTVFREDMDLSNALFPQKYTPGVRHTIATKTPAAGAQQNVKKNVPHTAASSAPARQAFPQEVI